MTFENEDLHDRRESFFYSWVKAHGFPNYRFVDKEPKSGLCGCVWFLKDKRSGSKIAIKTVDHPLIHRPFYDEEYNLYSLDDVRSELVKFNSEQLDHFHREVRIGLSLPTCVNVVRTHDVKQFICNRNGSPWWGEEKDDSLEDAVKLPVISMEYWDGSLEELLQQKDFDLLNRYIALAQVMNGLIFLYENGIQAHGDLKPKNLLWRTLKDKFPTEKMWPNPSATTIVGVADFGWSDVWRYFSGSKYQRTAERRYLSPERIDGSGTRVTSAADIFSFGVIAAEFLQHQPPYSKSAIKSDSSWVRCVQGKRFLLDKIESDDYRNVISRCLEFEPMDRPMAEEVLASTFEVIKELGGNNYFGTLKTLELWRTEYSDDDFSRLKLAVSKTNQHSKEESLVAIGEAVKKLSNFESHTLADELEFALLALEAVKSCRDVEDGEANSESCASEIRRLCETKILEPYSEMDLGELVDLSIRRKELSDDTHFWVFSCVVAAVTDAVRITEGNDAYEEFEEITKSTLLSTSILRAGYCFGRALDFMLSDGERMSKYCDWSIDMDSRHAEPYALRGKYERQNIYMGLMQDNVVEECGLTKAEVRSYFDKWKNDLEKSCELLPDWPLSRDWLDELIVYEKKYFLS